MFKNFIHTLITLIVINGLSFSVAHADHKTDHAQEEHVATASLLKSGTF